MIIKSHNRSTAVHLNYDHQIKQPNKTRESMSLYANDNDNDCEKIFVWLRHNVYALVIDCIDQ
ncbi:hypothetical protein DERP_013466 [Dermatophagoides pteronyssinus]|uniref:Uncharacterized protein n=1 Tax=Dermatophagoides pteronyssinus TaxID=6956 RepID=A0ABQ8JRN7_DERPT|nr:hypothetical protein DERP_013466 [Dermatophagoides pteronyssinus]